MEYVIYCLACSSHVAEGNLPAFPDWQASDVLVHVQHNPGCDLSDAKRHGPVVTVQTDGNRRIYTIRPGSWKDAELVLA